MTKRLRHVYPSDQVPHLFFHRPEGLDDARDNNNRISWGGDTIWSYSSPIALAFFDKKILLLRYGNYSRTTSKHQWAVKRAIPHDWTVFYFNNWSYYYGFNKDKWLYKEFIEEKLAQIKADTVKLNSNIYTSSYIDTETLLENITILIEEFCTKLELPDLWEESKKSLKKLEWTKEEQHRHEIKQWCLEKGVTGSWKDRVKAYEHPELLEDFLKKCKERKEKYEKDKEKVFQKKIEKQLKKNKEAIDEWINGKCSWFPHISAINYSRYRYYQSYTPVYLRLNPSNPEKEVQTSLGVVVPLIECKLLYRKFKQCKESNTEWVQNGDKFRIGLYQVEKIYKDNEHWKLLAGCHCIRDIEIEEFVKRFTDWENDTI